MDRLIIFIIFLLVPFMSMAHNAPSGWSYDAYCCDGIDCAQIKNSNVKITKNGFEVTLDVGDHPMITEKRTYIIHQSTVKKSKDEYYHICFYPDERTVRCFYIPDMGN